jgi:DNA helicase-2/ATP-dependent DNA helicase PcrA
MNVIEIDNLTKGGNGFDESESVIIGTAHFAKGQEHPKVICNVTRLPIIPPKHLPGHLPMGRPATIEEERRLLYVMVTRAKEECCVVASQEWNGQPMQRSRFVEELGLLDGQAEYGEEGEDDDQNDY